MKITCPACSFTRDVNEGKLPPTAAVATCPRCKERFRFRELAAADRHASPARASPAPEPADPSIPDGDVLPPGAVIPPRARDLPDEDMFSHPRDKAPPRKPAAPPGEEDGQESRRQAAEAYRRAAELPSFPDMQALSNPWEDPRDGYPAAFYQTAVHVLFAAPRFFAGLVPRQRLARALIFYLIVGLVQIFTVQFWLAVVAKILAPHAESDPQFAQLLAVLSREMSLPLLVLEGTAFISLNLFVVAFLYHMMFRMIIPARANFSLVFQVIAYASAPGLLGIIPLGLLFALHLVAGASQPVLLGIIPLGLLPGFVWSVACSVVGCRYALRISWMQTALSLGPLYLAFLLLCLQVSAAVHGM